MSWQPLICDSSFMLPTCFPYSPPRSPTFVPKAGTDEDCIKPLVFVSKAPTQENHLKRLVFVPKAGTDEDRIKPLVFVPKQEQMKIALNH